MFQKIFILPKQIEMMEGIYYPYWLYSCKVDGRIDAEGVRRRTTKNRGAWNFWKPAGIRLSGKG